MSIPRTEEAPWVKEKVAVQAGAAGEVEDREVGDGAD